MYGIDLGILKLGQKRSEKSTFSLLVQSIERLKSIVELLVFEEYRNQTF